MGGFAFGVQGSGQLVDGLPDPGRFRAVAQLAEELGYDAIWGGEHLSFHNPILDLTVALATFAAVTTRIRIGSAVYLLPLHPPALLAKQLASLDYISNGRLLVGVGVGGEGPKDFESVGVPVGERGARTDEGIAALRALLRESPASFSGRFSSFAGIEIAPRAVQPGGPPILVAGREGRPLARAGRLGDGWLPYMLSARRYGEALAEVRGHAAAAGRDPEALLPLLCFARVGDDGPATRDELRTHLSSRYGMQFEPHHAEKLCIAGTPEECVARIREYGAAGARHIIFNPAAGGEDFLVQVERLGAVAKEA